MRCRWSTSFIVIVRKQWASAVIFPDHAWLASAVFWRHALPADRSEKPVWSEELDRRERPGRETREAESDSGGTGPQDTHIGPFSTIVFSKVMPLNVGRDAHIDRLGRVKLLLLVETSGTVRKKIDWELRCGWGFLRGFCSEKRHRPTVSVQLRSVTMGAVVSAAAFADSDQSF